jgi:PucR family transcriptional regulator, purine catabolism regulatory protein
MLTTGVRLRGRATRQRELVAELDRAGIAALGFGVELIFKKTPESLVEEAQQRSFPVFEVPLPTPFRDIIGLSIARC